MESAKDASPTLMMAWPSWNSVTHWTLHPSRRARGACPATMLAANLTACALLSASDHARMAQGASLTLRDLGDRPGCRRHGPRTAGSCSASRRSRARAADAGISSRGGVRIAAITQHDVEQDHRRLRILRLLDDALVAQPVVDHRMRATAGEDIVAEVDHACGGGCATGRTTRRRAARACWSRHRPAARRATAPPRSRRCRR